MQLGRLPLSLSLELEIIFNDFDDSMSHVETIIHDDQHDVLRLIDDIVDQIDEQLELVSGFVGHFNNTWSDCLSLNR